MRAFAPLVHLVEAGGGSEWRFRPVDDAVAA